LKERNCGRDLEQQLQFATKTARPAACNSQITNPQADDWLHGQSDSRNNPLAQFAARRIDVSLFVREAAASPLARRLRFHNTNLIKRLPATMTAVMPNLSFRDSVGTR
jgi:hypothetical protein